MYNILLSILLVVGQPQRNTFTFSLTNAHNRKRGVSLALYMFHLLFCTFSQQVIVKTVTGRHHVPTSAIYVFLGETQVELLRNKEIEEAVSHNNCFVPNMKCSFKTQKLCCVGITNLGTIKYAHFCCKKPKV